MTTVMNNLYGILTVETLKYGHVVRISLHGEADRATFVPLEVALAQVKLDGAEVVHIDVTDLDFMDVASLRRLATFANQVKRTGAEVTTIGARPVVHRVASILKIHNDLGLIDRRA